MAKPTPTQRDPITCHVLDTTTGRPAPNISVRLYCTSKPATTFSSLTNIDGRITNWQLDRSSIPGEGLNDHVQTPTGSAVCTLEYMIKNYGTLSEGGLKGSSVWKLDFDTGAYFGIEKTFFPRVELTFLVKDGEHHHVPLLLGPYNYTTYRGS